MRSHQAQTWNRVIIAAAVVAYAGLAGCGNQGPLGPFAPGTFIFAPTSDPIDGFTQTDFGTVVESFTFIPPLNNGRFFPGSAALNGRIYAIGGTSAGIGPPLDSVEVYDPINSGVWVPVAALPTPPAELFAAAAEGRRYAIRGI